MNPLDLINNQDPNALRAGWDFAMPFGKYKGATLGEIRDFDSDYLVWIKNNIDTIELNDEVFRAIENHENSMAKRNFRHPSHYADREALSEYGYDEFLPF